MDGTVSMRPGPYPDENAFTWALCTWLTELGWSCWREVGLHNGSLDVLAVDPAGTTHAIEAKLADYKRVTWQVRCHDLYCDRVAIAMPSCRPPGHWRDLWAESGYGYICPPGEWLLEPRASTMKAGFCDAMMRGTMDRRDAFPEDNRLLDSLLPEGWGYRPLPEGWDWEKEKWR